MLQESATRTTLEVSARAPFLQRRGFALSFRLAVPADLHALVGRREITKALPASSRASGALLALQAAVRVKRVFAELREGSATMDERKLADLITEAKHKLKLDELKDEHAAELVEERRQRRQELQVARLQGENEGLRQALVGKPNAIAADPSTPAATLAPPAAAAAAAVGPTLTEVVADFLKRHRKDKAAMLKKHQGVLPLFLELIGNKPVTAIRQADINRFLDLVQKLPPRWRDECRKKGVSPLALAGAKHPSTMSPKSFEDTYKACLRAFLKDAKAQWQDQGFPTTLTTDGISYQGLREEGENRQRAFRQDELERLLNGPEMAEFAADPALEHRYWMVHLAFYTGARVNELCQINPQSDVLREAQTGIWYVQITEDTEGDERIEKSVKNQPSRREVPLHPHLLKLGFLAYADRKRAAGAKLLFPAFQPTRGRASPAGEKWFIRFLRELGLRDETPRKRLVGMHAFRSTLMALAFNSDPPQDVTPITGHRGGAGPVVGNYQGALSLTNKLRILKAVQFGTAAEKAVLAKCGAVDGK